MRASARRCRTPTAVAACDARAVGRAEGRVHDGDTGSTRGQTAPSPRSYRREVASMDAGWKRASALASAMHPRERGPAPELHPAADAFQPVTEVPVGWRRPGARDIMHSVKERRCGTRRSCVTGSPGLHLGGLTAFMVSRRSWIVSESACCSTPGTGPCDEQAPDADGMTRAPLRFSSAAAFGPLQFQPLMVRRR